MPRTRPAALPHVATLPRFAALAGLIAGAFAGTGTPALAEGTPAIERLIAEARPCRTLPGTDQLDFVRVDLFRLEASGDTLQAEVTGALGCKTSGAALIRTSVSADLRATAAVSLSTCARQEVNVELSNISGGAGVVLQALETEAERALTREIEDLATRSCRSLVGLQ